MSMENLSLRKELLGVQQFTNSINQCVYKVCWCRFKLQINNALFYKLSAVSRDKAVLEAPDFMQLFAVGSVIHLYIVVIPCKNC